MGERKGAGSERPGPSLGVTLAWLTLFAVAFAWIESAVVHYLHVHFYPDGFGFPLVLWPQPMLQVELGRELGTMLVLAAVAFLAGRSWWRRFAWFMYIFGVWDIFYYIWLFFFEGWPPSIFAYDLLFMVPFYWAGPVIAPVIVSMLLIFSAVLIIRTEERAGRFAPGRLPVAMVLLSWAVILFSFTVDFQKLASLGEHDPFRWEIFLAGLTLWSGALALLLRSGSSRRE